MSSCPTEVRWLEHTADVGLLVRTATPETVLRRAVDALVGFVVEGPAPRAVDARIVEIDGGDRSERLAELLEEVLFLLQVEGFLTAEVVPSSGACTGGEGEPWTLTLRGEALAAPRHRVAREVKAVTYHQLRFEEVEGGWEAQVVLDL